MSIKASQEAGKSLSVELTLSPFCTIVQILTEVGVILHERGVSLPDEAEIKNKLK
jgi:hypothetical protein